MKKLLTAVAILIASTTIFFSCKKEAGKEAIPTQSFPSTQTAIPPMSPALRLAPGGSTDSLTDLTHRLGVAKITLVEHLSDPKLTFEIAASPIYYNGVENFSLDGKKVVLTADSNEIVMSFGSEKTIRYNEESGKVTLGYGGNLIPLDGNTGNLTWDLTDENEFVWGLIILDELVNRQGYRSVAGLARCGTFTILNGGFSRNRAHRNIAQELDRFLSGHPNCMQYGEIEVSCAWENHICAGSVQVICN